MSEVNLTARLTQEIDIRGSKPQTNNLKVRSNKQELQMINICGSKFTNQMTFVYNCKTADVEIFHRQVSIFFYLHFSLFSSMLLAQKQSTGPLHSPHCVLQGS